VSLVMGPETTLDTKKEEVKDNTEKYITINFKYILLNTNMMK